MRAPRDRSQLTTGQAAERLGVSPDTVARMVDAGELPSERTPRGHRRIPVDAVDAIAEGRLAA